MKKIVFLGILIFIVSVGVGYFYSSSIKKANDVEEQVVDVGVDTNEVQELKTVEAVSEAKKVTPSTEFAIKEYYDECGHFKFEYTALPNELVNLTEQGVEDFYNDGYEVEELSDNTLIITKEINGYCDNHFLLKLENDHVQIYKLNTDGSYALFKQTEISKEYLPEADIENLEEGIFVYGEGKINAALEDFE